MGDNSTQEGIFINQIGGNIYITRDGADLHMNISIQINDEDDDVAFQDAVTMQDIITNSLKDFVKDYAEDGQEVD